MAATTVRGRIYAVALIFLLALVLSACGGGAGMTQSDATSLGAWPGHGWDTGARSGDFVAVAVDSTERNLTPLTQRLRLTVEPVAGGQLVRVFATDIDDSSAYLHLKYDGQAVHAAETQPGAGLGEDALFLGITQDPGIVTLGAATIGSVLLPSGEIELAQVRFELGPAPAVRGASTVTDNAPQDLVFSSGSTLQWTYSTTGDYDQNSEVNISDLAPLGAHFHANSASPDWQAAKVADGDGNTELNIADITPIGSNWHELCTAYEIEAGSFSTGPFAAVAGGNVAQSLGTSPGGGGFKVYSFTVATPQDGAWYVVTPLDGATLSSSHSNAVQYNGGGGSFPAPTGLAATDDGTKVTLTWTAPVGATPDGYNTYVSDAADMTGAIQMNAGAVVGTTYDCPLAVTVGDPHYFAVKAVYGVDLSVNSNIFGYMTGGTPGAPTGLAASAVLNQIKLDWTAPAPAPDGYNAYVSDAADMTGAIQMNLGLIAPGSTTTYTCPLAVDAATEHYFALKASTASVESGYSNIAHYNPGGGADTTPPVWQGGTGIKSVEPDDGRCKLYWFPAIDAQTPPVQYMIYYATESETIDWGNPVDLVDASQTSYTALGLTNGTRYQFAVRAQDSVVAANVTSNTNVLFATPMVFPDEGPIGAVVSSDIASVRMAGEEIPRMVALNHSNDLFYCYYVEPDWVVVNLNDTLAIAQRKFHPQMLAVGDDVHILFATDSTVYEFYGEKDADPATWTLKTIASGMTEVFGTGFAYYPDGDYFACVYAADAGNEALFYADRDSANDWNPAQSIIDGAPSVWTCDFAISAATGAQWAVAANGPQVSQTDCPEFWYATRPDRLAAWTAANTGIPSATEICVEIDPTIDQPVVLNPRTEFYNVPLAGDMPATDATVYTWTGSTWLEDPGSPLEHGDANDDQGSLIFTTVDTGRDPQLVFSPSGKAVGIWENLQNDADYSALDGSAECDLTGSWRISTRPAAAWNPPTILKPGIFSSNSVTAGEGYQHCLTCYVGLSDSGDLSTYIIPKYGTRNNYVEGDLYYFRAAW